ncbi:hypothetical protein J6I90_09930 [Pseudidiomarina sp. 1APP75-32.1]|uniref:Uncharacterized protein n=1 Tax=Pseudidiomarina terrestris TaxID=2820060 RepID=A0AAW7R1Q5_9GAMM|nr:MULTISPECIES: hypothetical protein [unclassified Pseudidiomarina]MDN7125199.1 hypothetical protein [Pseudidiomarina sp. 1APP75-32.1]MDN7127397.1 hypothetical protein [Pseudidiomarina sp. 1APR75-33.1]
MSASAKNNNNRIDFAFIRKAALEGVVIFIAVILGFFADDLREKLTIENQKNDVLLIIHADLQQDIQLFEQLGQSFALSAKSGLYVYQTAENPAQWRASPELEKRILSLLSGSPIKQNRAGYESAKAQNLLTQIDDPQLQRRLGGYYESTSKHMTTVNEMLIQLFLTMVDDLTPALEFQSTASDIDFGSIKRFNDISSAELTRLRASIYNFLTFARLHAAQFHYFANQMKEIRDQVEDELRQNGISLPVK